MFDKLLVAGSGR